MVVPVAIPPSNYQSNYHGRLKKKFYKQLHVAVVPNILCARVHSIVDSTIRALIQNQSTSQDWYSRCFEDVFCRVSFGPMYSSLFISLCMHREHVSGFSWILRFFSKDTWWLRGPRYCAAWILQTRVIFFFICSVWFNRAASTAITYFLER